MVANKTIRIARKGNAEVTALLEGFSGVVASRDIGLTFRLYDKPLTGSGSTAATYLQGEVFSHGAEELFYPASVCKIFYLAVCHAFDKLGRVKLTAEDHRAMSAMIRFSSNEATCYLLSRLTGTENGPVLGDDDMANWWQRRQRVQDYLDSWADPAYQGLRLWHGTYEESPYGRENAVRKHGGNLMSPLAAASLMHAIIAGQCVSVEASSSMRDLLWRDWERQGPAAPGQPDDQIAGFLGERLPPELSLWSKAGLTSQTRHDVAYLEARDGRACIAAIFTKGVAAAENTALLPAFGAVLGKLLTGAA